MTNPLTMKSWSPYVVGAGIGILSWLAFATANHPIGNTTAFENTAAEKAAALQVEQINPYFQKKADVAAFPSLQGLIKDFGDWGKLTLPELTGVSSRVFVAALAVTTVLLRIFAERRKEIRPYPPSYGPRL